jgi:hypothetical protein
MNTTIPTNRHAAANTPIANSDANVGGEELLLASEVEDKRVEWVIGILFLQPDDGLLVEGDLALPAIHDGIVSEGLLILHQGHFRHFEGEGLGP